ncbi:MAG: DNA-protecting protein DprA [Candidatus Kerfeldbacteria bacterium]|nr:DNA-protecting protein DprA [Candidatus Kerfeldbacteria bacterium]
MGGETKNSQASELPYWVGLSRCAKLGPTRFALLRAKFKSLGEVWSAGISQLKQAGLEEKVAEALRRHCQQTDIATSWQEVVKLGLSVVTIADKTYPQLLRQIFDPPPLLFYRGNLASLAKACLSVVGTRQATSYGTRVTTELVSALARGGLTIVSGLAYGIDTVAHRAALNSGGLTAAVLASGLDKIYPVANQQLIEEMINKQGIALSEFPPQTPPLKQNFPFRNRIIAGLSRATLVTEAAPGSGSLITARSALEANREVFAVPGSVFSQHSQGTNELIKLGAHLVTTPEDVLSVLGLAALPQAPLPPPAPEQTKVLQYLTKEPQHLDELIRTSGLKVSELTAHLSLLELQGYIRNVGGQQYVRLG